MTNITVSVVPQCDALGYESESYSLITIIVDGDVYELYNVVLIDKRDESGALVAIDVLQNADDYDGQHPEDAVPMGTVPLHAITSEGQYNLALANWIINTPEGQMLEGDFC